MSESSSSTHPQSTTPAPTVHSSSSSSSSLSATPVTSSSSKVVASSSKSNKEQLLPTTVFSAPENVAKDADIKGLSDVQLIQYVQQQEYEKYKERRERRALKGQEIEKDHKFWNTQPVLSMSDKIEGDINAPINDDQTVESVKQDPYTMPTGFEWCTINVHDPEEVQGLYTLLNENYVEDDECMFRFDYSIPFLQWSLSPPGFIPDWIVGVRNVKTKALFGCITALPVHVRVYNQVRPMAEINFLCVHKKLRTKRLAPVLIKEITRRVNLTDRWQAVYTAGVVLPKPVAKCRYAHRSLNPKKLIEVKFSYLPPRTTMASHIKNLKLPNKPANFMLRAMCLDDVAGVTDLLANYLKNSTKLQQVFTAAEVRHIFLPRPGVVNTFVKEGLNKSITDMCSFYHLPSTINKHEKHKKLCAVYSFYNVATTMPYLDLMRDLLVFARNEGADCVNALDTMENTPQVFEELKFGMGDGFLQYYVYNWKCPSIHSSDVGLVLV